jgi:hypothetical protein
MATKIGPFKESFVNRVAEEFMAQNQELYKQDEITNEELATQLTMWMYELKNEIKLKV